MTTKQVDSRQLSPAERQQRQLAAVKTGVYVKATNGLRLRYRKVRRLVGKMQTAMPWLSEVDLPAARAWAELEILSGNAFADLYTNGLTTAEGEPRRLLSELRQLRTAQLAYERDLGMTPAARMSLKVGDARAKALTATVVPADTAEVEAFEAKVLARLSGGISDNADSCNEDAILTPGEAKVSTIGPDGTVKARRRIIEAAP